MKQSVAGAQPQKEAIYPEAGKPGPRKQTRTHTLLYCCQKYSEGDQIMVIQLPLMRCIAHCSKTVALSFLMLIWHHQSLSVCNFYSTVLNPSCSLSPKTRAANGKRATACMGYICCIALMLISASCMCTEAWGEGQFHLNEFRKAILLQRYESAAQHLSSFSLKYF